jgi:hypothetical protein
MTDTFNMPKFQFTLDPWTELKVRNKQKELRDKFALQAMVLLNPPEDYVGKKETDKGYDKFAKRAFRIADAMIKQRNAVDD